MNFHRNHHISFSKPDPLANGLGDDIQAEQMETEAITLEERPDATALEAYWDYVATDAREQNVPE